MFNTNNELFANASVRTALSMALDRNAIANIIVYAKPATGLIPGKVFDSKSGTSFRQVGGDLISTSANVTAAQNLLSAANVSGGSFSITVRDDEVDLAVAQYVAGVWNQLGFNVTLDVKGFSKTEVDSLPVTNDDFQDVYNSGDFDVIAFDMTMLSTDAFQTLAQYSAAFSGNGISTETEDYPIYTHISGYSSAAYDAIIEAAYAETDRAKRAALLHDAEEMLLADMPIMPLAFLQDAYVASGELSGIKSTYFGYRVFEDVVLKDYIKYKSDYDT